MQDALLEEIKAWSIDSVEIAGLKRYRVTYCNDGRSRYDIDHVASLVACLRPVNISITALAAEYLDVCSMIDGGPKYSPIIPVYYVTVEYA